ncbi:hypothetical protein [Rhizobacter sp. P5_C2]
MEAEYTFLDINLNKQDMKILKALARELHSCVRESLNDASEESIHGLRAKANGLMDAARESMSAPGSTALDRVIDKQPLVEGPARFAMALDNIAIDCRALISRKRVYLSEI